MSLIAAAIDEVPSSVYEAADCLRGRHRWVDELAARIDSGCEDCLDEVAGTVLESCHPDSWLKGPDLREHVQGPSAIPASGMPGAQRENVAASRWGRRFHVDTGLHFADRLEDHPRSSQSFASGRSTMTNEVLSKYSWRAAAGLQQQAHPAAPSPHHLGTNPLPGMATSVPHQPQATDCPGARGRRLPASSEPSFRSARGRSSLACAAVIHHTSDRIHVVTAT